MLSIKSLKFSKLDKLILCNVSRNDNNINKAMYFYSIHINHINRSTSNNSSNVLKDILISNIKVCNTFLLCLIYKLNISLMSKAHANSYKNKKRMSCYLELIFMRNRFFPQLSTILTGKTIFNVTLGIISNYFSKKKNFLRSKASYLMLATYIRRLLIAMSLLNLNLTIKGVPIYLSAILKHILSRSNVIYKSPFKNSKLINEVEDNRNFTIHFAYVVFINSKSFGLVKNKKKGRLKRKIMKRVVASNNMLD